MAVAAASLRVSADPPGVQIVAQQQADDRQLVEPSAATLDRCAFIEIDHSTISAIGRATITHATVLEYDLGVHPA